MWPSNKRLPGLESTDKPETPASLNKRLRSACDRCHQAKMKCSGGMPCTGCFNPEEDCCYSVSNRAGRPKGAKNKRNNEQMGVAQQENLLPLSITHSSKTSQQLSQHVQQPMTPLTPFIDNMSFSPSSSAIGEPWRLDTESFLNEFMVASKVIPECPFQAL